MLVVAAVYGRDSAVLSMLLQLLQFGALLVIVDGFDVCDTTNVGAAACGDLTEHLGQVRVCLFRVLRFDTSLPHCFVCAYMCRLHRHRVACLLHLARADSLTLYSVCCRLFVFFFFFVCVYTIVCACVP